MQHAASSFQLPDFQLSAFYASYSTFYILPRRVDLGRLFLRGVLLLQRILVVAHLHVLPVADPDKHGAVLDFRGVGRQPRLHGQPFGQARLEIEAAVVLGALDEIPCYQT